MTSSINGIPLKEIVSDGVKTNEIDIDKGSLLIGGVAEPHYSTHFEWMTDFLGDLIPDEMSLKAGSGTGNAVALTTGHGGVIEIKTASDDGAITANASALELTGLDFIPSSGAFEMEARLKLDAITDAYIFVGFTDATQASTLEAPIFLVAGDIDSDATDACGVCFDTDGTTSDLWFHGGVKAGTDTVPVYSTKAPVAATYQTIRVKVGTAGTVQGFVDGVAIGDPVAAACTAATALLPIIVVANRGAAARNVEVDYIRVLGTR